MLTARCSNSGQILNICKLTAFEKKDIGHTLTGKNQMKLLMLIAGLFLISGAQASSSHGLNTAATITVSCSGNIEMTEVNKVLQFGGANYSKQDFAVHNGVYFAIQLASYKGFIDILLIQETRDTKGDVTSSGYIRTHGGTELDLVDNAKGITLTYNLGSGAP